MSTTSLNNGVSLPGLRSNTTSKVLQVRMWLGFRGLGHGRRSRRYLGVFILMSYPWKEDGVIKIDTLGEGPLTSEDQQYLVMLGEETLTCEKVVVNGEEVNITNSGLLEVNEADIDKNVLSIEKNLAV